MFQNKGIVWAIVVLSVVSCSNNHGERLVHVLESYSMDDTFEVSADVLQIGELLDKYVQYNGEQKAKDLIGEVFTKRGWIKRPPEANVLIEYAENILASCDSGAVLFSDGSYAWLCNEYAQHIDKCRQDVVVINRLFLDDSEYLSWLSQNTLLKDIPNLFSDIDTTDVGRSLFESLNAADIPCHQVMGCISVEFPIDSSTIIGFVRKYTSPDSTVKSFEKTIELSKTGVFHYDYAESLFYDFQDSCSNFSGVAVVHHYFSSFYPAFFALEEHIDLDTLERYLLKPIDNLALKKSNYSVLRYIIASKHKRPDLEYWNNYLRENWQEIEKKHPQFIDDYRKTIFPDSQ